MTWPCRTQTLPEPRPGPQEGHSNLRLALLLCLLPQTSERDTSIALARALPPIAFAPRERQRGEAPATFMPVCQCRVQNCTLSRV